MNTNVLLLLQAVLIFAQALNGGLATLKNVPPVMALTIAAGVGALQFLVQHIGNQTSPGK